MSGLAQAAVDSLLLIGDEGQSTESAPAPLPPKTALAPVPVTPSSNAPLKPKAVIVEKKTVVIEKKTAVEPAKAVKEADFIGLMVDPKTKPAEAKAEKPPERPVMEMMEAPPKPRDVPPPPRPPITGAAVTAPVIGGYKVGTGDKLRIGIYGEKDLSNIYQIDGNGMISLPLIGAQKVSGLTLSQIEAALRNALADGFLLDPSVAVEVAEYRPFYIMGEIRSPGSYSYIEGMNVLNAVAIGGGFTYRAKTSKFEVVRDGAPVDEPLEVRPDFAVMPGDIITINERFF